MTSDQRRYERVRAKYRELFGFDPDPLMSRGEMVSRIIARWRSDDAAAGHPWPIDRRQA